MVIRNSNPTEGPDSNAGEPEQATPQRETAAVLKNLLEMLFPEPNPLDIITIDDILFRYPLTKLGAPALTAIEQSQRILRARGEYDQIGLGEFHIGLIYLYWSDMRAAANQFALARQPWSLANNAAANCLAHYAQGLALYHAYHNEQAMMQFGRVERCLNRPPLSGSQAKRFSDLEKAMRPLLDMAQQTLRYSMWPEEHPATGSTYLTLSSMRPQQDVPQPAAAAPSGTGETAASSPSHNSGSVPPPISKLPGSDDSILQAPIPGHVNLDDRLAWYIVTDKKGNFMPEVGVGTWILVDRDLEPHNTVGREYVLVSSTQMKAGIIQVKAVADGGNHSQFYLGYRETSSDNNSAEGNSRFMLSDSDLPVDESDVMVVGVVEGFWQVLNGRTPWG